MMRQEMATKMKTISIVFIVVGIILLCVGFYKISAYNNPDSEYGYGDSINSYVGGDAYNYIINGTYFTAYAVMGTGSLIIATITGVASGFLCVEKEKQTRESETVSVLQDIESNLPQM